MEIMDIARKIESTSSGDFSYSDDFFNDALSTSISIVTNNKNLEAYYSHVGPKRDPLYIVIPITVVYLVILLTGILGNISTCIVIGRNRTMHTATNYYLFSLAISDLLLLITGLPQEIYFLWSRYPYIFGEVFCVVRGLTAETSANATVLTITAFTIERYVAICHPFLSHTMSKLSRVVKIILGIWLFSLAAAIPQALQFGVVSDPVDPTIVMCEVKTVILQHSFEISTLVFFVIPMTLITILYILIGFRLRASNMMKKESCASSTSATSITIRSGNCRHQGQSSRRVLRMLVAVVVAFFICWAPFHIQRLIAIYAGGGNMLRIYEIVTYISGVLYYVSTTINPMLYHLMSNKFRNAFKETFAQCCHCMAQKRSRRFEQRSYSALLRECVQEPLPTTSDNSTDCSGRHALHHCDFHKQQRMTSSDNPNRGQTSTTSVVSSGSGLNGDRYPNDYPERRYMQSLRSLFKTLRPHNYVVNEKNIPKKLIVHNLSEDSSTAAKNISNSSLQDIEQGALEDELNVYMQELYKHELLDKTLP